MLYYTALYRTISHCTVLYCTVLYHDHTLRFSTPRTTLADAGAAEFRGLGRAGGLYGFGDCLVGRQRQLSFCDGRRGCGDQHDLRRSAGMANRPYYEWQY